MNLASLFKNIHYLSWQRGVVCVYQSRYKKTLIFYVCTKSYPVLGRQAMSEPLLSE